MVLAHEKSNHQLLSSVKGLIFFAVPHRGAVIASIAKWPIKFLRMFRLSVNRRHVALLEKESDSIMDIFSQFGNRGRDLHIISFTETKKYRGHLVGPVLSLYYTG
jgi:hypothetical protein